MVMLSAQTYHHKEQMAVRIKGDEQNRKYIHDKLGFCKEPFDPKHHSDELVNIITGKVVDQVNKAVILGKTHV